MGIEAQVAMVLYMERASVVPGETRPYVRKRVNVYSLEWVTLFACILDGGVAPRAQEDGQKSIDSAYLCSMYREPMHMLQSSRNNIKITEPADFYICRALYDAQENWQIFGL